MNKLHLSRYRPAIYLFITAFLFISIAIISNNVSNIRDIRPKAATTLTLRPASEGRYTDFDLQFPSGGFWNTWDKVDDVSTDDDSTYIEATNNGFGDKNHSFEPPFFSLPADSVIDSIKVFAYVKKIGSTNAGINIMLNNFQRETWSPFTSLTENYAFYSLTYSINPWTGQPWTISEVRDLDFGVNANIGTVRVTQIYMEITYSDPPAPPPPPLQPPTVSLSASSTSVSYGGSTTLTWTVGGGTPSSCPASGGWSGDKSISGGSQTVSNLTSDTTFTISCSNSAGSDSDSVTVTVGAAPDTTAPTVSITSPSNGSTISGTKTFSASASDAGGIASIVLRIGSSNKKTCFNTNSCSYSWNTTSGSNGSYTLRATATDNAGLSNSDTHSVTVSNSSGSPVPDPDPDPDPQPPPPVPPPPGGGLPSLPSPPTGIPGVAVPIDPDIVNILKIKLSVPYLLGNITSPLIVGGFVQDLELKPGKSDYEVDVRGAKFALGKTLNIQIGGNKALIKKLKLKTKAPKQPVKFGILYLGDTNRDNKINDGDFQRYLDSIPTQDESSDVNADGVVNSLDWAILLVNFGKNGSR